MKKYLLIINGNLRIALHGPFIDDLERSKAALQLRQPSLKLDSEGFVQITPWEPIPVFCSDDERLRPVKLEFFKGCKKESCIFGAYSERDINKYISEGKARGLDVKRTNYI